MSGSSVSCPEGGSGGIINANAIYTLAELGRIFGLKGDTRTLRQQLSDLGVEPVIVVRRPLYSGRHIILAIENQIDLDFEKEHNDDEAR